MGLDAATQERDDDFWGRDDYLNEAYGATADDAALFAETEHDDDPWGHENPGYDYAAEAEATVANAANFATPDFED